MRTVARVALVLHAALSGRFVTHGFGLTPMETMHWVPSLHSGVEQVAGAYQRLLVEHALPTKMVTGATLAVAGDAIAQRRPQPNADPTTGNVVPYDVPRAASFAVFDGCYRALQHAAFPVLTTHLQGTLLGGLAASALVLVAPTSDGTTVQHAAAAMEQTLASQLIIVPFLYYPAFFALTGTMQGLDLAGCVRRAQDTFVPLMQRNLVFWIPVQFVQFAWIPTDWQIGFLSCAGLAWTVILSLKAGSAQTYSSSNETTGAAVAETARLGTVSAVLTASIETEASTASIQVVDIPEQSLRELVEA